MSMIGTTPPTSLPPDMIEEPIQERPKWPKVVGVLSIIWGGLMITCAVCGTGFAFFGASMIPEDQRAQMPPMSISPLQFVLMGIGVLMDVMLIVAGVLTIKRSMRGRTLHIVYAFLSLPMVAASIVAQVQQNAVMKQWYIDHPENPASKMMAGGAGGIGMIVGVAFTLVLGLGYPLFLLIWFLAVKRTHADMTGGMVDDAAVI